MKTESNLKIGEGQTIMLVDDDSEILYATSKIISRLGFRVLTAENGRTALEVFSNKRDRIRLIFLDVIFEGYGRRDCFEKYQVDESRCQNRIGIRPSP